MSSLEALLHVLGTNMQHRGQSGEILKQKFMADIIIFFKAAIKNLAGHAKVALLEQKGLKKATGPGLERLAV